MQKAYRVKPSPQLEARIKNLQSDMALDWGRRQKDRGKIAEARREFERAVRLNGNPEAKAELDALVSGFGAFRVRHVSRAENDETDRLANEALGRR